MYFVADDQGQPIRPMTHAEMIEAYEAYKPNELLQLADLYIDFVLVPDVEFCVFKDRLSTAVFMAEVATSSLGWLASERADLRSTGAHRASGWAAESDLVLNEEESWIEGTAGTLMFGGAAMAAVAALEALVEDLDHDSPRGLQPKTQHYLSRCHPSREVRERIERTVRDLAKTRNAYAHGLDGSPWSNDNHSVTRADCIQIFTLVGQLGVELTLMRPPSIAAP